MKMEEERKRNRKKKHMKREGKEINEMEERNKQMGHKVNMTNRMKGRR